MPGTKRLGAFCHALRFGLSGLFTFLSFGVVMVYEVPVGQMLCHDFLFSEVAGPVLRKICLGTTTALLAMPTAATVGG